MKTIKRHGCQNSKEAYGEVLSCLEDDFKLGYLKYKSISRPDGRGLVDQLLNPIVKSSILDLSSGCRVKVETTAEYLDGKGQMHANKLAMFVAHRGDSYVLGYGQALPAIVYETDSAKDMIDCLNHCQWAAIAWWVEDDEPSLAERAIS